MIKQLIKDLVYESITLSKSLTISKLIAAKINNKIFKEWLTKELEGYDFSDQILPDYRKIYSPITLHAEFPFGRTQQIEVSLSDEFDKDFDEYVYKHRVLEPIAMVEEQIRAMPTKTKGYINLPINQVKVLAGLYRESLDAHRGVIRRGDRVVGKVQYQNVLEMTKQKLIDTLIELDNEFPNLENEYIMTSENNEKAQNIITNNIFGNNNPLNLTTGNNNTQTINQTNSLPDATKKELLDLGVDKADISQLEEIVQTTPEKSALPVKVMKWLGSVSASIAAKGLYENLPKLTELVHNIISS